MKVQEKTRQVADTTAETVRETVGSAGETVRDVAGVTADTVREVAGTTAETVRDAAGVTVDAVRDVADQVPGVIARIIEAVSAFIAVLGKRSRDVTGDLEQRGRALAASIEPPKAVRRRRRAQIVAWAGGGFALGFLAGWIVHERTTERSLDEHLWSAPTDEGQHDDLVPTAPDLIDARSGSRGN